MIAPWVLISLLNISFALTDQVCRKQVNVILLIDGSASIRRQDFEIHVKGFLNHFVKHMALDKSNSKVGLVQFSNKVRTFVRISDPKLNQNEAAVLDKIRREHQMKSSTETDRGFLQCQKDFALLSDDGSPRWVYVITDGQASNHVYTKNRADELRTQGVQVYLVSLGHYISGDMREWVGCARNDKNCPRITRIANFASIASRLDNTLAGFCKIASSDAVCNEWADWGPCTRNCGELQGQKTRHRKMPIELQPATSNGQTKGKSCTPDRIKMSESIACSVTECKAACPEWSDWTKCTKSCGYEIRRRTRGGINDAQTGKNLAQCMPLIEEISCNLKPCPSDATATQWCQWDVCDPCDANSVQKRWRTVARLEQHGGKSLAEQNVNFVDSRPCQLDRPANCPVNATCSEWGVWSSPEMKCGQQTLTRRKNCSVAKYGGLTPKQQGIIEKETKLYEKYPCNQEYSGEWSEWGNPMGKCGIVVHSRYRMKYLYKGDTKPTKDEEYEEVALTPCPIDANCGEWQPWNQCVALYESGCGPGSRIRIRTSYNNPPAKYGGKTCEQQGIKSEEKENCTVVNCPPLDDEWTDWGPCSVPCGEGQSRRQRKVYRNYQLIEKSQEYKKCGKPCPIDEVCEEWLEWTACDAPCDGGMQKRVRPQSKVRAQFGGKSCIDRDVQFEESRVCNTHGCPVDEVAGEWQDWTACDAKCGTGRTMRSRLPSVVLPLNNGKTLMDQGVLVDDRKLCNPMPCDQDYSLWTQWTTTKTGTITTCSMRYRIMYSSQGSAVVCEFNKSNRGIELGGIGNLITAQTTSDAVTTSSIEVPAPVPENSNSDENGWPLWKEVTVYSSAGVVGIGICLAMGALALASRRRPDDEEEEEEYEYIGEEIEEDYEPINSDEVVDIGYDNEDWMED